MIQTRRESKSPALLTFTLVTWGAASYLSWNAYSKVIPDDCGFALEALLRVLPIGWMIFWLWGVHNWWHQTVSLFTISRASAASASPNDAVAILYMTCDDFDPIACQSCLNQQYARSRLLICDDSKDQAIQRTIDLWVQECGNMATIVRREDHAGFKAGNLNYAIENHVDEEFIVICDADEVLPPDFVSQLLGRLSGSDFAFAQASHRARTTGRQSRFAQALSPSVDIMYRYCLPTRNAFGFVSCFGTGVMIRKSIWMRIGGFPEIVSEDLAFSTRALAAGFRGVYVEGVCAEEAHPQNYKAFVTKYCKVVGGTVEFFQREFHLVWRSRAACVVEKLDILLTFSHCYIGMVTTFNLIGAIVLAFVYQGQGGSLMDTSLLWIYMLGPFTPILPLLGGLMRQPRKYVEYLFVASVAHVSLIPRLTAKCVEQTLMGRRATFDVTGRTTREVQRLRDQAFTIVAGVLLLVISLWLKTGIGAPMGCFAVMVITGPLLSHSEKKGILGRCVHYGCALPYILLLLSIFVSG
jgi:cellulose synthase/poly-beta-1,6-N-acetylglucosamine synthase-like glycosyltransferase